MQNVGVISRQRSLEVHSRLLLSNDSRTKGGREMLTNAKCKESVKSGYVRMVVTLLCNWDASLSMQRKFTVNNMWEAVPDLPSAGPVAD